MFDKMQCGGIPLHLVCEEDVVLFLKSMPNHKKLCERTLAEVRLIASYLQIAGVVTMSKQEYEARIMSCYLSWLRKVMKCRRASILSRS